MAEPNATELKTPATADNYEEYKRVRKGEAVPSSPSDAKETDSPAEADSASSVDDANSTSGPKGESGSASEAGGTQKKNDKPKRGSADQRISELTRKVHEAEEGRRKLELQIEELLKGRAPEAKPQQAGETVQTPPSADTSEAKPNFKAIYDKVKLDPKFKDWDEINAAAQEQYEEAVYSWRNRKAESERQSKERETQQAEAQKTQQSKIEKAREKYADFDYVMQTNQPAEIRMNNPGLGPAIQELDNGFEALYALLHDPEEAKRITNLPPPQARLAMLRYGFSLENTSEEPKPQAVVPINGAPKQPSRAPAPASIVRTGTSNGAVKTGAEARDYAEYKKIRNGTR